MLKYCRSFQLLMAYSETKIIIGGIAHVPILIFIVNLIKGKFASKAAELKVDEVKDEVKDKVKDEETKIKLTEPKKEEITPENDKESEVKDEVLEEEGGTENEKQSDVEEQKEEKEVS